MNLNKIKKIEKNLIISWTISFLVLTSLLSVIYIFLDVSKLNMYIVMGYYSLLILNKTIFYFIKKSIKKDAE